jgi:hypothetical protein
MIWKVTDKPPNDNNNAGCCCLCLFLKDEFINFDLPVDVSLFSAILVCIFSTFFLDMSPATIHENLKMSGLITINYNPLMAVFGVGGNKSACRTAIIPHDDILLTSHKNRARRPYLTPM